MRVLHLLSSTGYHGAENMAAQLIRDLSAQGIENYVGAFRNNESSNTDILGVVRDVVKESVIFDCPGKLDVGAVLSLRRYIGERKVQLIHSHKYKTNFYAAVARLGTDCALVATCHNWLVGEAKMRLYAAIDKRVLRAFDCVVGVSERVAGELRRHVGAAKTIKIDNGVDLARFDGSVSADEAKKALGVGPRAVVGFVGRLAAAKGVSQLLRAVRSLGDRGIELDVLIVGEGEMERELRNEADGLGLRDRVRFLGRREDMPRVYAAMDVLVLPSFEEAFPMVVLEGMAAGVPVVSTRVGDVPYMLEGGRCGILVEPGSVTELGEAIRALAGDRTRARQIGSAAQRRAREHFSSRAMAGRYREIYEQVWQDSHRAA